MTFELRNRSQLIGLTDPVQPFVILCLNCFNQQGSAVGRDVDIVQDADDRETVTLRCQQCCATFVVETVTA